MSKFTKTKRILAVAMMLALTLVVISLVGCGEKTTEVIYELADDGSGYLVNTEGTFVATSVTIPAEHEGLPVVGIKEKAFKSCKNLELVVIEAGDADFEIRDSAFKKCKALKSVIINRSGDIEIGYSAFSTCENLTSFDIPSAEEVSLDTYCFEYINRLTVSIGDAELEMDGNAFLRKEKNYGHSLNLTNCTGTLAGYFIDVNLVGCTFDEVSGSAKNLVLDNTKLLEDEMFYFATNATFRGSVVYHNNYKESWFSTKGSIIEALVIESIGEGSEFSQMCEGEYYPLAASITIGSSVTSIPAGVFGNGSLSALDYWWGEKTLSVNYKGAAEAFRSMPYDTLYNGNLMRGEYTLKSLDGESATITFIDPDGNAVATVEATIGDSLDYDTYAPLNTTLVAGEMINGYYTDADHTVTWGINDTILGDMTVYLSYVNRALLQKAEIECTNAGNLVFISVGNATFRCDSDKNNPVTLSQIKERFHANEFATLEFFGDADCTTPAPNTIDALGLHKVYARVTSWDKSVSNIYVLDITIKDIYEVTFLSNGSQYRLYTCTEGYTLSFPSDPHKLGHSFLGWSTDGTEGNIIDTINYKPTESHTLTAVFRQDVYTIKIADSAFECQVIYAQSITLPLAEELDHYVFKGYEYNGVLVTDSDGCTISSYRYEHGITLTPRYEPIRYSITLRGEGIATETVYYTVEDYDIKLSEANRDWFDFVGWYTEENGGGSKVTSIETSTPVDYVLYALFTPTTYTVRFMDGEEVIGTQTINYENQTITPPSVPEKDGYTSAWESFSVRAENFDVAVVRTPIVYTITYQNTFDTTNNNPTSYTIENTVALAALTREHYRFVGWKDENGQLVTTISKGTLGNITLTAEWEIAKYTVHFVLGENSETTKKVEYNTQYSIDSAEIPTATDKLFVGWYSDEALTEPITGKITVVGDVYVYAKWLDSVAISVAADFEKIRENLSGTFHLAGDIDMRGEIISPISDFTGVLDGMGYKLYNFTLKISSTLSSFGLFNVNNGTIRRLTLDEVNCSVTTSPAANGENDHIGILVGTNKGTISDCSVISPSFTVTSDYQHTGMTYYIRIGALVGVNDTTGSITNCKTDVKLTVYTKPQCWPAYLGSYANHVHSYVGGLVGTNRGTISMCVAVNVISCTGTATGGNSGKSYNYMYVGGIVGSNEAKSTVEKSYTSTAITVSTNKDQQHTGNNYVGAFIGTNSGIVRESYAIGSVNTYAYNTSHVGGFIGTVGSSGDISNCYTAATVTSQRASDVGGFVGRLSGSVQNSYATGDVSVDSGSNVAGFVGFLSENGVTNKSFTTSNVKATGGRAGFFCAYVDKGTGIITNSYFAASASVTHGGKALSKAEEYGAKRDYLSNITNASFLESKMYFYPEYWIFTTDTPVLKWEIQTDGADLTGSNLYLCACCGKEFIRGTGNSGATFYFDIKASCETDGLRYFGCTECNKHFAIITTKATGHRYTDDSAGKDLCNDDVLVTYTCQNSGCGHSYKVQLHATGHSHNHTDSCLNCGYAYIAPGCTSNGSVSFVCDTCGETVTKVLLAEHSYEFAAWETAPDCESDGYAKFICTRCGESGVITTKSDYVHNSRVGHMDIDGDGICDRDECDGVVYDANDFVEITTLEELLAISKNAGNGSLEKTYILKANIDLSGVAWEPIGTEQNPFTGVFIGGGFTIKNVPLFASDATLTYGGLFGYNSGVISELTIEYNNYPVICQNRSITFGSIAAFNSGTINRCTVKGSVDFGFLAKAQVDEPGAAASATQSVTLGLACGVNDGYIVGCVISASYSLTFESYAFMGENIDHFEGGLLTSGNYKNMKVNTSQTLVVGAVCGINNMSITDCSVTGAGTINNYLALSQFVDGRYGFLKAESTQSFGAIAGNQNLVGVKNNTHSGALTYQNEAGTHTPTGGNDDGNNFYGMSCKTTITIYS